MEEGGRVDVALPVNRKVLWDGGADKIQLNKLNQPESGRFKVPSHLNAVGWSQTCSAGIVMQMLHFLRFIFCSEVRKKGRIIHLLKSSNKEKVLLVVWIDAPVGSTSSDECKSTRSRKGWLLWCFKKLLWFMEWRWPCLNGASFRIRHITFVAVRPFVFQDNGVLPPQKSQTFENRFSEWSFFSEAVWLCMPDFTLCLRRCGLVCFVLTTVVGRLIQRRAGFVYVPVGYYRISLHRRLLAWHASCSVLNCLCQRKDAKKRPSRF